MRATSLNLTMVTLAVLVLSGAECDPPPESQPLVHSLTVTLEEGTAATIPSNGLSYATLVISGKTTDPNSDTESVDTSAITVRVNEGRLTGDENTQPDETFTSLVGVPQDGVMKVNFTCQKGMVGEVMVQIDNKNGASTVFPMTCSQPEGETKVIFDASSCASTLVADGVSSCNVNVDVFYDFDETVINDLGFVGGDGGDYAADDLRIPQPQTILDLNVINAVASSGSVVVATNTSVLAVTNDGATLAETVALEATDENGAASFYVFSPVFGLEQVMNIQATGTDLYGVGIRADVEVTIKPFAPQSDLIFETSRNNFIGDGVSSAALSVHAKNLYGQAAELASLDLVVGSLGEATLEVRDDSTATLSGVSEEKRLILDNNGEAVLLLTGPVLEPTSEESLEITLTVSYNPGQGFELLQETLIITISPPGSLIMNVSKTPDVIQADESTSVEIAAEITVGSEPQINHPVTFKIPISDQSKIHFGQPNNPDLEYGETIRNTNENRVASVTVSAASTDIRALTTVYVSSTLDGSELSETVRLDVQRAPFLQSIVFQAAAPSALGIIGSSRPTSSVVSFILLDDLSNTMADVPVDFRVNDTAGAGVSVTSRALSDASGTVFAVFSAGTQAGPVTVVATADPDGLFGGPVTVESAPIAITGGIPNFANSSFACAGGASIFMPPASVPCAVTLVDRFTDISTGNNLVQFRAEGGNIQPAVAGAALISANFSTGDPGPSVASILSANGDSWSYGALLPTREVVEDASPRLYDNGTLGAEGGALNFFEYCFDNSSMTPCDLVSLCATDQNQFYCPLPPDIVDPSVGCWSQLLEPWDHIPGGDALFVYGALSALILGSDDPTINDLPAQQDPYCPGKYLSGEAYFNPLCGRHSIVKQAVDSYIEVHRACGAPISCLTGLQDLDFIDGDECDLAFGCFDFTTDTPCPQDGLYTIMASFRGEEAFVDLNGNGVFDFTDENDNDKHDSFESEHEPFIDMPEPFLDKNNNCGYDAFSTEPGGFQTGERMALYDAIRHSDLFVDEDGSGDYGYQSQEGDDKRDLGNGQYDRDKDIFFQTYLLSLTENKKIHLGEPCSAENVGKMVDCTLGAGRESLCIETEALYDRQGLFYEGIAQDCRIPSDVQGLEDGTAFELAFNVQDMNGNCHSPGYAGALVVNVEGAVTLNGSFAGSETTIFDDNYCGFFGALGNTRNRTRPWCEKPAELGAQNVIHSFVLKCSDENAGPTPFAIEVLASGPGGDTVVKEFGNVYCPYCGDGFVDGTEACDDGNEIAGDGCNASCIVECGWRCENDPSTPDGPQVCSVASPTDFITAGFESCDDGNLFDGDGCSENQQQEPGYDCTYQSYVGPGCHPDFPGQKSTCVPLPASGD